MHYKITLITKEFPTNYVIDEALNPYNEEDFWRDNDDNHKDYPAILWDWYQVGGRYGGFFKLDIEKTEEEYEWEYVKERNGKVFRSYVFDKLYEVCPENKKWLISEHEFYNHLGYQDGYLRVDGGKIADMMEFDITQTFGIIDKNGTAYARQVWNGSKWEKNENFDDKAKAILADSKDCYICTIDIHD